MSDLNKKIHPVMPEKQLEGPVSPLKRLIIGLFLMMVVAGLLGTFQLFQSRAQLVHQGETNSKMLAGILQQAIGAILHKTDMTLLHVADEIMHQSATGGVRKEELGQFIDRQFRLTPELDSLRISDAKGIVTIGSGSAPTVPVSIADRPYFAYLRDHADAAMVVSKPIVGKISNKWVISCARRITSKNGTFGGVVFAVLPLQQFNDLFKTVPVGTRGTISLRRDDLTVITRYSATDNEVSELATGTANTSEAWLTLLSQGKLQDGSYTAPSITDGVRRIHSYSRISTYPLYVNVGLAVDDILSEARQEVFLFGGAFLVFLLMSGMLIRLVDRNWQKTRAAEKELKRNYGRLELMQEVNQYHAVTVQELLDFSLEKVIALTESSIGYIYHYNEEVQQFVLNTWSKDVMASCTVAEPQSLYQLEQTGLWGEVVRQRKPIVVNNFAAANSMKKGYPEGHVPLSRFLSIPIFDNDRIVAVVGVANKTLLYDQQDVLQLTLMMEGVWKIATRLKLEDQILRAGQEWQSTFDSINDSIALIDADQRVIRCNLATTLFLGREFADIIGQPCWKLFHGVDAPIADCPMGKARLSLLSETSIITHQERWLEVTVDPILSYKGEMSGAVHLVRDVTERINLVNSIKEEKALYEDLVDTQPAGMYRLRVRPLKTCNAEGWRDVVDSHYSVDLVSSRFCDILGIDAPAFIENPGMVVDLILPEDRADFAEKNAQAVNNFTTFKWEGRFGGKQSTTWVRFESMPRQLDNGEVLWTGVISDISDDKRSEERLREMQAQILQNDKLATIGQLAAGVAHEINNPIGFVSSNMVTLGKYIDKYNRYIDLLEGEIRSRFSGGVPEQIQELHCSLKLDYVMRDIKLLVEESNEGIDRVKRIVQDLRTFSRTDSSVMSLADLNSCIDSTINIVINEIKYAAELKREFGDLPKVSCNAQQINQVLMNLLINAAHAIQAKGEEVGEIVIRTWSDGENAFVSVSDSGCGIAPENCGRIFDAFFTTKEVGKGTGLGLSISEGIIRKHGGEITLSSEMGTGSTFTIRLPLSPADHVDEEQK